MRETAFAMEQLTLRVSQDTKESLQDEADDRDQTLSEYMRDLINARNEDTVAEEEYESLRDEHESLQSDHDRLRSLSWPLSDSSLPPRLERGYGSHGGAQPTTSRARRESRPRTPTAHDRRRARTPRRPPT